MNRKARHFNPTRIGVLFSVARYPPVSQIFIVWYLLARAGSFWPCSHFGRQRLRGGVPP